MKAAAVIRTERMELIPATPAALRAELIGHDDLAKEVGARVPSTWPPDLYDESAIRWTLEWISAHPDQAGWSFYYFTLPEADSPGGRELVGLGGFKGAPGEDGTVEIGYSVLAEHRRRGLASEAVRAFIAHAFADERVERVIAETLPNLAPSIGVLVKCGFEYAGNGSEPGVIRYTLERPL